MTVIILGDPHIGKNLQIGKTGIGANLNSRLVDQINLLDWTLDTAIDKLASHIIITGDVFEDPNPSPYIVTTFLSWLKRCQSNDINVHIIFGNHDFTRSGFIYTSPLDIINEAELDNVKIYNSINTIFIDTSAFTFMPFRDRKSFSVTSNAKALSILKDSLIYELSSIPITYKKIVVGHLAIEGSIPIGDEFDDINNELFCSIDMFNGYDYVWMGHVHSPQVLSKNPYVAHIGSMDISNFGETNHKKHIVILDTETGEHYKENLPTRNLKKISITIPKDTEDSTEYVLSELKKETDFDKSIVRLEISLASPDVKSISKSIIEKFLIDNGTFNVSGISESKKISIIKKDNSNSIDTKMDVVSAINKYAETYVQEELRANFIELAIEINNLCKVESK